MKIGIYGHPEKQKVIKCSSQLVDFLLQKNIECFVEENLWKKLNVSKNLKYVKEAELAENVELFVAFGGDGTVLRLSGIIKDKNIPILAVNAGKLGFLTDLSPKEFFNNIDKILQSNYQIEKRIMLEGIVGSDKFFALNDVVVSRGGYPRIIKVRVDIGEHYINTYHCDGIIVATPTGSTAYSLSSGGPIVHPSLEVFVISPIASHSLSARHVVAPSNETIKLTVLSENISSEVHADGKKILDLNNDSIIVKKSKNSVRLIKIVTMNFFDVLRNKLNWGKENR